MPYEPVLYRFRTDSVMALGSYLESLPGTRELPSKTVKAYQDRDFIFGWSIRFQFEDRTREFHVLIGPSFPFLPPRIILVDRPDLLSWPHVEKDGALCLLQNNSSTSARDPVGVFQNLFASAVSLVSDGLAGRNSSDFEAEFNTYWQYRTTEKGSPWRSLLSVNPCNRIVGLWRGSSYNLIGDDVDSIKRWLAHLNPQSEVTGESSGRAALVWLTRALHPIEYPATASDLFKIIRAAGGTDIVAQALEETSKSIRIVLAAPTPSGPVLAGLQVRNPSWKNPVGRQTDPVRRGFRPGHVPAGLLAERYLNTNTPLTSSEVARVDHDWIHGRGRDPNQAILKKKSVVVLGCGSIGAVVAVALAKAGAGKLTLIDDQDLEWANIGRHALGARSVGHNKATALAKSLQSDHPHLEISGTDISVQELLQEKPDVLGACNLIVSVTADWSADQALAEWHRGRGGIPSLMYGWAEAHAAAGHAAFMGQTSCLECGFDATGTPGFSITAWPTDQDLQEPACGAAFQPYGPMEIASTVPVVGNLALDCLLGKVSSPTHRIWIGPKALVATAGGSWSAPWRAHPEFRDAGALVIEQPWPPSAQCARCETAND